jgi:hypothetical protein
MVAELETVKDYVTRVGTVFAVAMYRSRALQCEEQASLTIEARRRLAATLEKSLPPDAPEDDETYFHAAMGAYEQNWYAQAKDFRALELEAIRLNLPGTNPGKQEHLDGNGISLKLSDIEEELNRRDHT